MRDMGLGSWPARRARMTPEAVAMSQGSEHWTYAEVEERANRLANAFQDRGIVKGDRVAYLGSNSLHMIAVIFAAAKIGAVSVPLNTRLAPPEMAYILNDSAPSVLIWDEPFSCHIERLNIQDMGLDLVSVQCVGSGTSLSDLYESGRSLPVEEKVALDDLFMIQYTSGTSGRPKGVMLTHGNVTWNVYNLLVDLDITSSEVSLVVAPLFHTAALNQLFLPTFLKGGRCLIEEKWDPERALRLIDIERVTFLFGVTSMYLALTQSPMFESTDLSSVNVALSGGAPLPEKLLSDWLQRGLMIVQGYGLTEASPGLTMLRKDQGVRKVGSAGTSCFFSDVCLVDPNLNKVDPGSPGEVLGHGPNVSPGYWNNQAATTDVFVEEGWLRTGDLATQDADGFITVVGRVKDMIISGGENVYPAEVEAAIHDHPSVSEAAVIGVPDNVWGEVGRAIVTLREGASLDERELLKFLDGRIARYKIPKSVVITDELPHNASGKLRKQPLRERFGKNEPKRNG